MNAVPHWYDSMCVSEVIVPAVCGAAQLPAVTKMTIDLAVSPHHSYSHVRNQPALGLIARAGLVPPRDALLRRGSAILHMLGGLTPCETQQNLMQKY